MLHKSYCATCIGIDVVIVTVEVDVTVGIGLHLVGLPDVAVRESILRVTTALASYGYSIPGRKIVVNLAPADIRKEGSSFDLAIALGLIVAGKEELPNLESYVVMGELALDGTVRSVPGVLPVAVHAAQMGYKGCIFPAESASEASEIEGINVYGITKLSEAIDIISGNDPSVAGRCLIRKPQNYSEVRNGFKNDFKNVKGQIVAKRGLEIAAAGSHNLLLVGNPGSGKTMMASCLPSILPPMTREESIITSKIYSIAGKRRGENGLMRERPFRTPHHSASLASFIGGGPNAMPGEISLATGGVLYLDEVVQFGRTLLDALRQPVEDGKVTISRLRYKVEYPSSFMLIASMNPCPCGYFGDNSGRCRCTPAQVERYMSRLSGPFLDRIDMHIYCYPVDSDELIEGPVAESSEEIAARVVRAREIQGKRFKDEGIFTNSQMDADMLERYCRLERDEKNFLKEIIRKLGFSARAYGRILKLARTIADLDGSEQMGLRHLAEAVQFRNLDRQNHDLSN